MKKIYLLLSVIPLFAFSTLHKYYVALTEIEHNSKSNSVQMIMNVFMDDIEVALNKDYNIDAQISNSNEIKNLDDYFLKYLKKHFKVLINQKEKNYRFIGKEYDGNIVFFYLEIDNITEVKTIEIQNDVLIEYFPDQQNLIKAKINGKRKSLFLSEKDDKGLLKF